MNEQEIAKIDTQLIHVLLKHDKLMEKKPGYNKYALALYIKSLQDNVYSALKAGQTIRQALIAGFNDTLLDKLLKAVGEPKFDFMKDRRY